MWYTYKKFTNIDEAREWGKKYYSYWLPRYQVGGKLRRIYDTENIERYLRGTFSKEEKQELRVDAFENKWFSFYCGGNWGLAVNEKNRWGNTGYSFPDEQLTEMQAVMDNRLDKSHIPENVWGYRFLKYEDLCLSMKRKHISWGSIIEDKGYMGVGLVESTLKEEFDIYDTLLKIMIPQGAKGLYVDLISNRSEEQEVLFARGIKMRVLLTYRRKGKKIIICKMLKPIDGICNMKHVSSFSNIPKTVA